MSDVSDDVTIDRETARVLAQYHRDRSKASRRLVSPEAAAWHESIAKRLDPPRSLRDEVIRRVADVTVEWCGNGDTSDEGEAAHIADTVLAVVADWLAAQPLTEGYPREPITVAEFQRDHDVRLLRGGDDA